MSERYISLSALQTYFRTFLAESKRQAEITAAHSIHDYEDGVAAAEALLWREA